jgi:hypothetical protein
MTLAMHLKTKFPFNIHHKGELHGSYKRLLFFILSFLHPFSSYGVFSFFIALLPCKTLGLGFL